MKKRRLSLLLVTSMVLSVSLLSSGCSSKTAASKTAAPDTAAANTTEADTTEAGTTASDADALKVGAPLWEAGGKRDKIVVVSDIHLGIEDKYTETLKNLPLLIDFLQRVQNTRDVRELVIDGDFLDEWFLPVYYPSYTDQYSFIKVSLTTIRMYLMN